MARGLYYIEVKSTMRHYRAIQIGKLMRHKNVLDNVAIENLASLRQRYLTYF